MKKAILCFFSLTIFIGVLGLYHSQENQAGATESRILFTPNEVKIDIIYLEVAVGDLVSDVKASYKLRNLTKGDITIRLEPLQPFTSITEHRERAVPYDGCLSEALPIGVGRSCDYSISYKVPTLGKRFRLVQINPSILINGQIYAAKVGLYRINVTLPESAKKIVEASHPLDPSTTTIGEGHYTWTGTDVWIIPLWVKWTEIDVDVSLTKRITMTNMHAKVNIEIMNKSDKKVDGLVLKETFPYGNVDPIGPKEEFSFIQPEHSDSRYIWEKRIDTLGPSESKNFEYEIRVTFNGAIPKRTVAILDGTVVALSNATVYQLPPQPLAQPNLSAVVLPAGWSFNYKGRNTDHHLNEYGYEVVNQDFNASSGNLNWTTNVTYCDKNKDDDYKWDIYHTIVRLQDSYVFHGAAGWKDDGGGESSRPGSHRSDALKSYEHAVVYLEGVTFDFKEKDHHIKTIGIDLKNIRFERSTGTISWDTDVVFRDKNGDDNYRWKYRYGVLAFNNGYLGYERGISITDSSGGDTVKRAEHRSDDLKGPEQRYEYEGIIVWITQLPLFDDFEYTLLPLAWKFRFDSKDHHIKKTNLTFRNITYYANGKVDWDAHVTYADKNGDDPYKATYSVAVVGFKSGEVRYLKDIKPEGPFSDSGGSASRDFVANLSNVFVPITWFNGTMDGTETGIDCGGDSPIQCQGCITNDWDSLTRYTDHPYFFMRYNIEPTAIEALYAYANEEGHDPQTWYVSGPEKADRYVRAVAWFVAENMEWMSDGIIPDVQTAGETIHGSGDRECGARFCGDCEDYSILRAVLLRSLGFDWKCIFSADHHKSDHQGQVEECGHSKKGDHTFNLVYFKGRYRILDYGEMQLRYHSNCNAHHAVDNIWNDNYGKLWFERKLKPFGGKLLMNYPGCAFCPSTTWNWRTYYADICK